LKSTKNPALHDLKTNSSYIKVQFLRMKNVFFFFLIFSMSYSCNSALQETTITKDSMSTKPYKDTGSIVVYDPSLSTLLDSSAKIEILAEGFQWSEGPLWIADSNYLLFSDIPPNTVMKWDEKNGVTPYLFPSGYTGTIPRGGEPGANGLILDQQGRLVLCQHGDRKMARMDAPLDLPSPKYITIADNYEGKKLNSPNDAVYHSNGDLYFTDPPYGLLDNVNDSSKELNFQGVFRVKKRWQSGTFDQRIEQTEWNCFFQG
jgi:gluconolactonase